MVYRAGLLTLADDILPCPFCGSPAGTRNGWDYGPGWRVECTKNTCGVRTPHGLLTREAALAVWNARAADPTGGSDVLR